MAEQLDLLTAKMYKRTGTSKEAAESAAEDSAAKRAKVLETIKNSTNGLSATGVAQALGWHINSARPRISELAGTYFEIEDSGRRSKTQFGKSEKIWIIKRS
jgi:hypothetical protein